MKKTDAIIDLNKTNFNDAKVAGVKVYMRHLLCLSFLNIENVFIINATDKQIKNASKDKRLKFTIKVSPNVETAIQACSNDFFMINDDVVYTPEALQNISSNNDKILKIKDINIFYIPLKNVNLYNPNSDKIFSAYSEFTPRSFVRKINEKKDIKKIEKAMVKGLRTSGDTLISRYMNRPISLFVTSKIMHYRITPNMITTVNLILGLGAVASVWLIPGYIKTLLAGTLFNLSSILDGCDGEIARLKFQGSKFGAKYDDFSDDFTNLLFFLSISFYTAIYWLNNTLTWVITIVGGTLFLTGKLLQIISIHKTEIDNLKYRKFYFEKQKEDWGKNPILWIFNFFRHIARNDFLSLLAFICGALYLYWPAPYVILVFGGGLLVSESLEMINYLKGKKRQE